MIQYKRHYIITKEIKGVYKVKLLISGSRGITDFDLAPYIPQNTDTIICGGAKGIDQIAEAYADRMHLAKIIVRPQYERFGRAAPLKRNEEMVRMADEVLIIWDGVSRGTEYTAKKAEEMKKTLYRIVVSDAELSNRE